MASASPFNPTSLMAPPVKKGPSLVLQLGLLAAATAMAAGIGFVGGGYIRPAAPPSQAADAGAAAAEAPAAEGHGEKAEGGHGGAKGKEEAPAPAAGHPALVPLAPITTNLAAPAETWLRLELAVEFKDGADAGLADAVQDDVVSYLRTLKLHQIEGPSGLIHLKEDLSERAAIRTGGKVSAIFVRGMVLE